MSYSLGLFLMVFGLVQLLFCEFCDATRDRQLADTLRVTIYLAAIVFVELGVYLADVQAIPLPLRLVFYVVVGAFLIWRRCRRQASRT